MSSIDLQDICVKKCKQSIKQKYQELVRIINIAYMMKVELQYKMVVEFIAFFDRIGSGYNHMMSEEFPKYFDINKDPTPLDDIKHQVKFNPGDGSPYNHGGGDTMLAYDWAEQFLYKDIFKGSFRDSLRETLPKNFPIELDKLKKEIGEEYLQKKGFYDNKYFKPLLPLTKKKDFLICLKEYISFLNKQKITNSVIGGNIWDKYYKKIFNNKSLSEVLGFEYINLSDHVNYDGTKYIFIESMSSHSTVAKGKIKSKRRPKKKRSQKKRKMSKKRGKK
jgi:hypothetical protein